MGFVINGFIGSDIDASGQTKSGQVTTDTQAAQEEMQINQEQLHLTQEVLAVEPVVTELVQICK